MNIKKILSDTKVKSGLFVLATLVLAFILFKVFMHYQQNKVKSAVYQMIITNENFPFIVNANDNFMGKFMIKNKGLNSNIEKYYSKFLPTGSTVIDIGSRYGYHTILFAKKAGKFSTIYAVEPRSDILEISKYNFKLNGFDNIKTINSLLYSYGSKQSISAPPGSSLWTLLKANSKKSNSTFQVQAHVLDDVIKNIFGVNLLRINGNGTELEILLGARRIIEKSPNIGIFINWNAKLISNYSDIKKVTSQLADIGFNFWLVDVNGNLKLVSSKDLYNIKGGDIIITKKDIQN